MMSLCGLWASCASILVCQQREAKLASSTVSGTVQSSRKQQSSYAGVRNLSCLHVSVIAATRG